MSWTRLFTSGFQCRQEIHTFLQLVCFSHLIATNGLWLHGPCTTMCKNKLLAYTDPHHTKLFCKVHTHIYNSCGHKEAISSVRLHIGFVYKSCRRKIIIIIALVHRNLMTGHSVFGTYCSFGHWNASLTQSTRHSSGIYLSKHCIKRISKTKTLHTLSNKQNKKQHVLISSGFKLVQATKIFKKCPCLSQLVSRNSVIRA